MPPIGHDDQTHALHVLNAVQSAKALVADIALGGGLARLDAVQLPEPIKASLRALFAEVSKLQVFESRAAARGTLHKLDDEKLAEAVQAVADRRVLTVTEEEILATTPEDMDRAFSIDADVEAEQVAGDAFDMLTGAAIELRDKLVAAAAEIRSPDVIDTTYEEVTEGSPVLLLEQKADGAFALVSPPEAATQPDATDAFDL